MPALLLRRLKENWKSGLTVSLVSIPLSVSLAVASHATPSMGIVTAVWAGLLAAIFGGSNYNIVGPTGALSGIIAVYAMSHGAGALPSLAILVGAFILVAYFARLERYLVFVPGSAIHGFTLGVAFIIGLNQLNFAFGLSGIPAKERFIENVLESLRHLPDISLSVAGIFAASLAILLSFKRFAPKMPGAIVLAPLGILAGYAASKGIIGMDLPTLGSLYPSIEAGIFLPYEFRFEYGIVAPAMAIALIAIIETMVSAKIADGMTGTKHRKQPEMRGLALANIASGLAGGIPATAALARTSLNVKAGATSKVSAGISSIAVAVICLFLLRHFAYIPLAVIAAILVFVAIQMIEAEHFKRMFRYDRKSLYVSLVVAFVTVWEDPIIGIIFGVGAALLLLVEKISRGQFDLVVNDREKKVLNRITDERLREIVAGSDTIVYSIAGLLCYVNSEAHVERFREQLHGFKHVVLRLRSVYYIDLDGMEAFDEIVSTLESHGKEVYVAGANAMVAEMLQESGVYQALARKGRVFEKSSDALRQLGFSIPAR